MPYSILLTSRGAQRDRACAELQEAFERLKGGSKVVFDITAWVYDTVKDVDLPPEEYEARRVSGRARADMLAKDYGVECSVFDHSESSFDADVYAKAVASANVYYTDGGNTWALQHWWRMHGTHKMVGDRVRAGEMLYVGASAGGIISGKCIDIALWKNWDAKEPWQESYSTKSDWSDASARAAMNLLGGMSFFPHYESKYSALFTLNAAKTDHVVLFGANGHGLEVTMDDGASTPIVKLLSPEGVHADTPCCMPPPPSSMVRALLYDWWATPLSKVIY